MTEHDHAFYLLGMAQKDFKALCAMKNVKSFSDEIFGFHAQQTVEKALKAWIAAIGAQYPKTHDISTLLHLLERKNQKVKTYKHLLEFNAFAVQYRYETIESGDQPLKRTIVLKDLRKLLNKVATVIK